METFAGAWVAQPHRSKTFIDVNFFSGHVVLLSTETICGFIDNGEVMWSSSSHTFGLPWLNADVRPTLHGRHRMPLVHRKVVSRAE